MEALRGRGRAGIEAQRSGVRVAIESGSFRLLERWRLCRYGSAEIWSSEALERGRWWKHGGQDIVYVWRYGDLDLWRSYRYRAA